MAGYQFELKKYEGYNHKTKTFKVKQFTDTNGQKFPTPNTIYQFSVGDEFTLLDIVMPKIYITKAEKKLHEQALKEYEKISKNNLKYTLDIDPLFLKNKGDKNSVFFKIGDYIHLKDKDLNINKESRIISIDKTELPTNIATIDEGLNLVELPKPKSLIFNFCSILSPYNFSYDLLSSLISLITFLCCFPVI